MSFLPLGGSLTQRNGDEGTPWSPDILLHKRKELKL